MVFAVRGSNTTAFDPEYFYATAYVYTVRLQLALYLENNLPFYSHLKEREWWSG